MLEQRVSKRMSADEPQATQRAVERLNRAEYQARVWARRQCPWIDRLAGAWLIQRFIDSSARFLWLCRPAPCLPEAPGFDFDGAAFTHVGSRITFEGLLASFMGAGMAGLAYTLLDAWSA